MKLRMALIFVLLAAGAGDALGQQRPGGNGPLPGDPGYGGGVRQQQMPHAPRPIGEWVKTWGAIAEGKSKPGYSGSGRVTGALTKEEAESRALGECHLFGGSECAVLVTYYDECVALAYGPEGTGAFAKASSMEMAGVRALSYCSQRNNGADCKIDDIRCSEPRFTRY